MINSIKNWEGSVEINGTLVSQLSSDFKFNNSMTICLHTEEKVSAGQRANDANNEIIIDVRQYMTKKATDSFDFMRKWNNDIPMPLRTMQGKILKETPGMYKMCLHAVTDFEYIDCCMKCGKQITNPVSKYFGMGPECGGHGYVHPFDTDEELQQAINSYKETYLANITWEGWVIKSAIVSMKEV